MPSRIEHKKQGPLCGLNNIRVVRLSQPSRQRKTRNPAVNQASSYVIRYETADGLPVTLSPEDDAAIRSLAIPPMWRTAHVCKPNPKLLWVAQDERGKWHYRYTREWTSQQEREKIDRLKHMNTKFWDSFKRVLERRARGPINSSEVQHAIAALILRDCSFRPGWRHSTSPTKEKVRHYGLTSLELRHVTIQGFKKNKTLHFDFIGKSGQKNTCLLQHPLVVSYVERSLTQRAHTKPLFPQVTASSLSQFLKNFHCTPKYFRTWNANSKLLDLLTQAPLPTTLKARKRILKDSIATVAKHLNNLPSTTKKSYLFSGFMDLYLHDPARFQKALIFNVNRSVNIPDSVVQMIHVTTVERNEPRQKKNMSNNRSE